MPTIRPACGPPSSLSPEKVDDVDAGRDRLARRRLVRQAPGLEIDQRAAAEILDQRQALLARQRHQLGDAGTDGEARDARSSADGPS